MAKKPPIVDTSTFTPKPPPDPSQLWNMPVTVGPPPQKPPETLTQTATPNPSPKSAKEFFGKDVVFMPNFQDLKKKGPVSNKQLLNFFKLDPVNFIHELNRPQYNLERVRLQKLINEGNLLSKDQDAYNAWQTAKAYIPNLREKSLILSQKPQPKTQAQPAPASTPSAPPIITPTQTVTSTQPTIGGPITPENAPKIEAWMNGLKGHIYDYFSNTNYSTQKSALASQDFTRNLLSSLSLYRGGLASFYLDEGAKELIFSALGPLGNAFRSLYEKDIRRKMAWMKNPLNPQAINYYLSSLPNQMAFKLLYIPAKATFGILARGGAPLISKVTMNDSGVITQKYIFSPLLKVTQFNDKFADKLDKLSGVVTDRYSYGQYIKNKNLAFSSALKELKRAKAMGQPGRIVGANKKIKNLLKQYDGNIFKSILKPGLTNTARRLREHHRDPISFLLALIGGGIWDLIASLTIRPLLALASRALNLIPGVSTLRANLTKFLTSDSLLNTTRIGGSTIKSFIQGTFSLTTGASMYAGASIGGWIANALGLPTLSGQVVGGGIGTIFGSIYTTTVKMSANSLYFTERGTGWVQKFDNLLAKGDLEAIQKNYINGFKPGPLSNLSRWFFKHPFARLPINGLVIADLGVKFLGWNPLIAYPSLLAGDYLWQIKGTLGNMFGKWFIKTPLGHLITDYLSIGKWAFNLTWEPIAWETGLLGEFATKWVIRPWANSLSKYFGSFFNPGFFAGFSLIPLMTPVIGAWGYILGPLAGSAAYILGSRALIAIANGVGIQSIGGISIVGKLGLNALPQINAWSWLGMGAGWILDLVIPGAQPWLVPLFTYGLPVALTLIPGLASWLTGIGATIGGFFYGAAYMIAGLPGYFLAQGMGMVLGATIATIATIAGLTLFTGFVIYSSFWIPLQQSLHAGPQSACFSQQTKANAVGGSIEVCSIFTVTTDLLTDKAYIRNEIGIYDLLLSDYPHLENNITRATRQTPGQALENLNYVESPEFINPPNPNVATNRYTFPVSENVLQLADARGVQLPYLVSWLSTFTGNPDSNKMTIFELITKYPQFSGLQQMVNSSFDLLKQVQADKIAGNNDTIDKFNKMKDYVNTQKNAYDSIRDNLVQAKNSSTLDAIKNNLISAQTQINNTSQNNPFINQITEMQKNCPYQTTTCQELIQLYQSWPTFFNNQLATINGLIDQANNLSASSDLTGFKIEVAVVVDSANLIYDSLDQQYQSFKSLAEDLKNFQGKLNNWLTILNATNPTFLEIQNILVYAFKDMFDKKYFFTPNGTRYELCVKGTYVGDPNKPAHFYSQTNIVQSGFMGISQNSCTAISFTTLSL